MKLEHENIQARLDLLTRDLQKCENEKKKVELDNKNLQAKYNALTDQCNNDKNSLQISLETLKKQYQDCTSENDRLKSHHHHHHHPHRHRHGRGHGCKRRH